MRLNRLKTRIWLAVAVAIASLGVVSSASAMLYTGDLDGPVKTAPPAAAPGGGFEWGYALAGVGIALVLVVGAFAAVRMTKSRARLAT